jgi:hypothetical protein
MLSYSLCVLFPQLLYRGSADVPALLVEVTQAREAAAATEAAHDMAMLVVETSVQEAATAWDCATLCIKDAEDWATLMKRENLEKESRVEVKNVAELASACEDANGFVRKIILLEDELVAEHRAWEVFERERQAQFEELSLLQTQGSKLCHVVIGPRRARHHLSEGMQLAALLHTEGSQCLGARPTMPSAWR